MNPSSLRHSVATVIAVASFIQSIPAYEPASGQVRAGVARSVSVMPERSVGKAVLYAASGSEITPSTPSKDTSTNKAPVREPDVIYVPTPQSVVDKMLEMAEIKKGDVVYDLGCGDGRIVVNAAKKFGVKAIGFDINPQRVKESLANVKSNKVDHLVTIKQADIFTLDLSEATVVTLYLLPDLNVRLMPQLQKLKPGSRILSHDFDMRGAKPVMEHKMEVQNDPEDTGYANGEHTLYKWIVPWEKEPPRQ